MDYLSLVLGLLLSTSEILPYIKTIKGNGILDIFSILITDFINKKIQIGNNALNTLESERNERNESNESTHLIQDSTQNPNQESIQNQNQESVATQLEFLNKKLELLQNGLTLLLQKQSAPIVPDTIIDIDIVPEQTLQTF